MPEIPIHTISLHGTGVHSICARLLYAGNLGSEVVLDSLEQGWVIAIWERAVQGGTNRSDEVRAAMCAVATSNVDARRRALDTGGLKAGFTTFAEDIDGIRRAYHQEIRHTLGQYLPVIGFSPEEAASVISHLDTTSNNITLALIVADEIVRGAAISGSMIMEMTHKANEIVYPYVAGPSVKGIDDVALQSELDLAPWFSALNRFKYYLDKRMTLDEVLGDYKFRESNTLFQVRENQEGLPRLFADESYSRIYGSELLVFESTRWMSFKFHGIVLNFEKTTRALSCKTGTDIHPTAVQTVLLLGSHEGVLTVPRIKEAQERLLTRQENEIEKMYQLTLDKVDHYDGKDEDIKKEIMAGMRIKQIYERMAITYCDTEQRIGACIRNARISGVTFNGEIRAGDMEFERPSNDEVQFLASDMDYTEFQTAQELDAWFESVLKENGVLGDRKNLRDMLRARIEKLIATKFKNTQIVGESSCWARLYRSDSQSDRIEAEYLADLPHMITAKTTLEADLSGMTQGGFILVHTAAKMWYIKGNSSEPGIAAIGTIELKEGDYVGVVKKENK